MNQATKTTVSALGTIFGISGISHGFFEFLQGNVPTAGMSISAIGEAQRMWIHGDEPAFTLIPNFLVTGLAAMLVGLTIIVWSNFYVQRRHGATVLLLLFILLLLVGGGVAQIIFFPFIWLAATRIHSPLKWWRKVLPVRVREFLRKLWRVLLILGSALLLLALVIATTGFIPGVGDPQAVLSVMVFTLVAFIILLPLIFISGFARDISAAPEPARAQQ